MGQAYYAFGTPMSEHLSGCVKHCFLPFSFIYYYCWCVWRIHFNKNGESWELRPNSLLFWIMSMSTRLDHLLEYFYSFGWRTKWHFRDTSVQMPRKCGREQMIVQHYVIVQHCPIAGLMGCRHSSAHTRWSMERGWGCEMVYGSSR